MEFVILAFATYGISNAVTTTDGPFNIFYKLKHMKYSKAFECFTCLSIWVGLLLSALIAGSLSEWFLYGIAAAGAAMFLDFLSDQF